jgi:hypothetical protein
MNEQDLRDCFAMFAMNGFIVRGGLHPELMPKESIAKWAYEQADAMIEARTKIEKTVEDEELGIAAVRTKRKYPKRPSDL